MSQHFLLSSLARTLSPLEVAELNDDEAHDLMAEIRWGENFRNEQICPKCGVIHKANFIATRKQWSCKHCKHRFSVTSGTIFSKHKLPIKLYLYAIAVFVNAVKGISALQLSRDLGIQYKTAFVLAHKIRHSLMNQQDKQEKLSNEVHIDGTYVHSSIKPKNKKSQRVDRRLKQNENPLKRCVIVMRERFNKQTEQGQGAKSTFVFIAKNENTKDINEIVNNHVKAGTTICADENSAYDNLLMKYDLQRVNHSVEYCSDKGITNNLAESYFSRFKRMYYGQVHHMSNSYLLNYAIEIAYREDNRRVSNRALFSKILKCCLFNDNRSCNFVGYWNRA